MKRIVVLSAVMCLSLFCCRGFSADLKIGFVDFEKAFNEYQKTKAEDTKLKNELTAKEKELEKMAVDVSKMRDELDLLSDIAKKQKEEEIRGKVKELQKLRKDARQNLLQERNKMWLEIYEEIKNITSNYGKQNGYNFIFDDKAVIYKEEGHDITNDIIKLLNSGK